MHSDTLRTLVVGPGLPEQLVGVRLTFDLAGTLSLHAESETCISYSISFLRIVAMLSHLLEVEGKAGFRHLWFLRTRSSCFLWAWAGDSGRS